MKHKAPQSELPAIGREVFNLVFEESTDGERLGREMEAAAQRTREAKEVEQQQQQTLI